MSTASEKLAQSLEILSEFQKEDGSAVIKSSNISRTHRERLLNIGFLKEVIKGWYISTRPDQPRGDTTGWYTSYWHFISAYLNNRFDNQWCLSPEMSLMIHSGIWTVPRLLLIRSPKGSNNTVNLPDDTSIFDARLSIPDKRNTLIIEGIRIYSLPMALIYSSPVVFTQNETEIKAVMATIKDASEILEHLLEDGSSTIAGRLAGAFRNIGQNKLSEEILDTMKIAGYDVRESDPFAEKTGTDLKLKGVSPYVNRIRLLWGKMRNDISDHFPPLPGLPKDIDNYLQKIEEKYVTDAYHSLSIEGYKVSTELIEKVRLGNWDPESDDDQKHKDAMAAKGYWDAFNAVKESIKRVLTGQTPGKVWEEDHSKWFRQLFAPSVAVGLIKQSDLAGYRRAQVYIRQSRHVPMNYNALPDVMPVLSELLENEPEPWIRSVLGHFIFVYIHPYMDGNGRIGRFLMNLMLASGGYPWIVVPVERRNEYMQALENASVEQNINPFNNFILTLFNNQV